MIGDLGLSKALEGLETKIDAFTSGQPVAPEQPEETSETQNALRVRLLANAAWLRESFPAVFAGGTRLQPDSRRVVTPEDKTRVGRFLNVFHEELEIVRAARNAVAHA